ncbi:MAG: flagellar basal-body MS-ring/collar protein FliF, partial [Candidatus Brocadiia bacterium]
MPLGQQLIGAWNRLSLGHRALLILLSALLATALVGTVLWSGQPEFQILCTGLSAEEVSGLAGALRDAGIESRLSERGDAVLVPAAQVNQARMVAAEQGVPGAGSMGFEAFREPKIGMTPFAERITYVNALQNELAATIASLNSVVHARVHLVVPERELFARDETKPTASVLVVTRGGQTLRQRHAQAIANLVAAGVEGLSPNDVTITDGQGNVISGGGKAGAEIAAGDQLSYRRSVEEYLSDKAESMLAMVLGRNCCEVRVAAELTFEDRRQTRRQYDPEQRVVVSERIESSESSGAGTRVG